MLSKDETILKAFISLQKQCYVIQFAFLDFRMTFSWECISRTASFIFSQLLDYSGNSWWPFLNLHSSISPPRSFLFFHRGCFTYSQNIKNSKDRSDEEANRRRTNENSISMFSLSQKKVEYHHVTSLVAQMKFLGI